MTESFQNIVWRNWSKQLSKEYDGIAWEYRLKLIRPPIEILAVESYWGQWDPFNRLIKISAKLIENNSWDVVKKILKHEMAHQIVSDLFRAEQEGHGPLFRKACELIGLESDFQGSQTDLPHKIRNWKDDLANFGDQNPIVGRKSEPQTEETKILNRVQKLMALAQSSNENEALASMEKVQELFEKYNLKRIINRRTFSGASSKEELNEENVYTIIELKSKKLEAYQSHIGAILQEFYFVKIVYASLYYPIQNETYKTLEILGAKENVQMAEYVYFFLKEQIYALWKDYSKRLDYGAKFKRSYLVGLLQGFQSRLRAMKEHRERTHLKETSFSSSEKSNRSLMILENDKELSKFVSSRFPRLRSTSTSRSGIYGSVYESGKSDGKQIVIHKGVNSGSNGHSGKFLTFK